MGNSGCGGACGSGKIHTVAQLITFHYGVCDPNEAEYFVTTEEGH